MSAHYDRPAVPYAIRHSPVGGPSRSNIFYERDPRAAFVPPEVDRLPDDRPPPQREERAIYAPQEYIVSPRDIRSEHWVRDDPWYHANYPRLPTPPPPHAYPPEYQAYGPSPPWGARAQWEADPNARDFGPSVAWRHHREPSSSRLSSILNPVPGPRLDDHRWRDLEPPPPPPAPHRDYSREYPPDYYPYNYQPDLYHDRPVYEEPDMYRTHHPHDERAASWGLPVYRPPSPVPLAVPRMNRSNATREHRRPRQMSLNPGQSPRVSDHGTPAWIRENGPESGRNSCEDSLSSPIHSAVPHRERFPSGPPQIIPRGALPPTTRTPRAPWEGPVDGVARPSEEREKAARLVHSPKLIPNETSRLLEKSKQADPRDAERTISPGSAPTSPRSIPLSMSSKFVGAATEHSANEHAYLTDSNHSSWNSQASQSAVHAQKPKERPRDSVRRFSPVRHITTEALPVEALPKPNDSRPAELPAPQTQTTASPRKGVMSVKNLVTPIPCPPMPETSPNLMEHKLESSKRPTSPKIPSPAFLSPPPSRPQSYLAKDEMQIDTAPDEPDKSSATSEKLSPPITAPENPSERPTAEPLHSASPTPDGAASPQSSEHGPVGSLESSAASRSLAVTPQIPDEDVEEVEAKVAETHIQSPTPAITPPRSPSTKRTCPPSANAIVPSPRPKADTEAIRNTLRKAIIARREFSNQTKEERVNPIMMENLSRFYKLTERVSTSPEQMIKEVLQRVFAQDKEEQHMNTRSVLAANFAEQQELLAEKTQRLRKEYLELHEAWTAHCVHLDSLFKANDSSEVFTVTGRTTRRSAAGLGGAVRSDLEMERLIATLGSEDLTDPNHLAVRNVATIPDMISVAKGKVEYLFDDTNGRVDDPASFYDARSGFHDWTPEEEKIFYEKYAEFPKQFGAILSFLPHKTTSQCVLYYYIRKKRLIDFRNATNVNNGRRRRGGGGARKPGKQKSNALLADVQQADSKRPATRRGRRGRGGGTAESNRGRGGAPTVNGDHDLRPKRRRLAIPKVVLESAEAEEASLNTDQAGEPSVAPVKRRRGRKPKVSEESPAVSPAPTPALVPTPIIGGTRFVEGLTRRFRSANLSSYWTDADRDEFLHLLSRHGKDFKRIASSMPNKTTIQVSNYYKSHLKEWDLEAIAATASARSRSESPDGEHPPMISRDNLPQNQTPTSRDQPGGSTPRDLDESQVSDAAAGVGSLTLENKPSLNDARKDSIINASNQGAFQTTERTGSQRNMSVSASSHYQAYSSNVNGPPIHSPASMSVAQQQILGMPSESLSSQGNARELDKDQFLHTANLNSFTAFRHTGTPITLSSAHLTNLPFISGISGGTLSFSASGGNGDLSQRVQQISSSGPPGYQNGLPVPASLHLMTTTGIHYTVPHANMQAGADSSHGATATVIAGGSKKPLPSESA